MQELAVLAARALATQRQFTAVADNVANANTHGYKRMDLQFQELVSEKNGTPTASYVADRGLVIDYSSGALEKTGNQLDVALGGEGFFAVRVGDTVQYTRKGQFLIDNAGMLMTPSGNPVLDNAGAEIQLPVDATNIMIGQDGVISTDQGQVGQLGVFNFSNTDLGKLQRTGDANYLPQLGASAIPAEKPVVRQGFLEGSNVNPVEEMVTMQDVSKAYVNAQKLLKGLEDLESDAIQTLGKGQ